MDSFEPRRKSYTGIITVLVILFVINVVFWFFGPRLLLAIQNNPWLSRSQIQIVYLADGQVFVGHIKSIDANTVVISKAYNLRITATGQTQGETTSLKLQSPDAKNISLIPWGFYQPLKSPGTIFINRQSVIFWETLDDDSQVATQIKALNK